MMYLFVLDGPLAGWGFAAGTGGLTKCYEPLQKLRVRLSTCKTSLSPPVTLCY